MTAISKKIDMWPLGNLEKDKAPRAASSRVPGDKGPPSTLPEEVVDFEKFLQQTGGRLGGWDAYDHQNFVKVRNRHQGKPAFVGAALEHLPGRTQEEVQQHEKWYQKFLALEERKREVRLARIVLVHCMGVGHGLLSLTLQQNCGKCADRRKWRHCRAGSSGSKRCSPRT